MCFQYRDFGGNFVPREEMIADVGGAWPFPMAAL